MTKMILWSAAPVSPRDCLMESEGHSAETLRFCPDARRQPPALHGEMGDSVWRPSAQAEGW